MTPGTAVAKETWVSVAVAARMLNRSTRQIERYIESGQLRYRRAGMLGWRMVNREDVMKILQSR